MREDFFSWRGSMRQMRLNDSVKSDPTKITEAMKRIGDRRRKIEDARLLQEIDRESQALPR